MFERWTTVSRSINERGMIGFVDRIVIYRLFSVKGTHSPRLTFHKSEFYPGNHSRSIYQFYKLSNRHMYGGNLNIDNQQLSKYIIPGSLFTLIILHTHISLNNSITKCETPRNRSNYRLLPQTVRPRSLLSMSSSGFRPTTTCSLRL